jgi:thioester reductase-like protein
MTPKLQKFYAGLVIFITEGTGFMGKLLLLKLLQSCPDVEGIIVLLREKRGQSCRERL